MSPEDENLRHRTRILDAGLLNAKTEPHVEVTRFYSDRGVALAKNIPPEATHVGNPAMVCTPVERAIDANAVIPQSTVPSIYCYWGSSRICDTLIMLCFYQFHAVA